MEIFHCLHRMNGLWDPGAVVVGPIAEILQADAQTKGPLVPHWAGAKAKISLFSARLFTCWHVILGCSRANLLKTPVQSSALCSHEAFSCWTTRNPLCAHSLIYVYTFDLVYIHLSYRFLSNWNKLAACWFSIAMRDEPRVSKACIPGSNPVENLLLLLYAASQMWQPTGSE